MALLPRIQPLARIFSLRLAFIVMAAMGGGVQRSAAQTQVLTFDTLFTADNLNQFGTGAASGVNYSTDLSTSWNVSQAFGGFTTGLFGDVWGAGGTASTSGTAGFNASLSTNGGSLSVYIPNRISLSAPSDNATAQPTISITQDRSALGGHSLLTSTFPSISFSLGAYYQVDARVDGTIAYGVGSASGAISLNTLFALAAPGAYATSQITGLDPFNNHTLDHLISFDGSSSVLTLLGKDINLSNGLTKTITSQDVLPVNGVNLPTSVRLGTVTVNPFFATLNANSTNSLTATNTQANVFGASLDLLGAVSAAFGLPVNPFDINANIPGTPINVRLQTLSLLPHLDLGLTQTLSLAPRTYVGLSSNYPVTYLVNGQTITTTDLLYQLPDDASASSVQILTRPTQSDWQLYSRVFIDPQLHNQISLIITGGLDIQALRASVSAYGAGTGFGPLIDGDFDFSQNIDIYDEYLDLVGGTLSRVYRNPIPLFGEGVIRVLPVGPNDVVQFFSQSGSFDTTTIDGSLTIRDAYFSNTQPLTVNGLLHLDVAPTFGTADPSASTLEVPQLFVSATGVLQVDPDNLVLVNGLKDGGGHDILDSHGNRQVGFITSTGFGQGAINTGTFLLGGTLSYDGPDITSIGSQAFIALLPSAFISDTEIGHRFNNFNGQADPNQTVDGLRYLSNLAGTLIVAGQDLNLLGNNLNNSGSLTVTNGYNLTAISNLINTGTVTVGAGSSVEFAGLDTSNLSAGTLSNMHLTLGGNAGQTGGIFLYGGTRPSTLAGSTGITLSGDRPTGGYFQAGASDALTQVTGNAGTLRLQNGAIQTVGGTSSGLNNSGALQVDGSGSALTVNGALTNSGTVALSSGGALTASGALTNISSISSLQTLSGGTWDLGGTLSYSGSSIQRIAGGTSVTLSGSGGFDNGGNALGGLSVLDGTLTVASGGSLTTSAALTVNSALTVGDGASLTVGGLTLNNALTLAGTLHNTGTAISGITTGTSVTVRGTGALQDGGSGNGWAGLANIAGTLDLADGGTVRTDTALALASNGVVNLGADGTLQVTGSAFTLSPSGSFIQNGGTLILGGNGATETALNLADGFSASNLTLQLGTGGTTVGRLAAAANVAWTNTSGGNINGAGDISGGTIVNRGYIGATGGTLTVSNLAAPLVNSGQLGSYSDRGAGSLVFDHVDIVNYEGATRGSLEAFANISLLNGSTLKGGNINIYAGGSFTTGNVTVELGDFNGSGVRTAVGDFTLNGAMTVLQGQTTNLTANTLIGNSGSLTLQGQDGTHGAAQLAFGSGSSLANSGLLTLGGGSAITGVTINNFGTVNLSSGTVHLSNIANGAGGTVNLLDGTTLDLATGTFSNGGLIHLSGEPPSNTSHSTFLLTQDLTLTGGGTIQLGGYNTFQNQTINGQTVAVAQTVWATAGSGTLVSALDGSNAQQYFNLTLQNQQLIGRGDFGQGTLSLVNQAGSSIGVYGAGSILNIVTDSGGFLNQGTLNVDVGATMNISGGAFHSLDANGFLTQGAYRIGGTLQIDGLTPGAFDSQVAITFEGTNAKIQDGSGQAVTVRNNLAGGALTVANGSYAFTTDGTHAFTNAGLLRAANGGTLSVTGGNFTNFSGTTLTGGTYDSAGILKFDGADIRTNDATIIVREAGGVVGKFTDQNGLDALRNFTLNNGTFSTQGGADYVFNSGIPSFSNNGSIIVGDDSFFDLNQTAVTNTAGSSWWIAGRLYGGTSFNTGGTVTLFGPFASFTPGVVTDPVTTLDGHMIFAGGYAATYGSANGVAMNITNNGLWEIGSPSVADATGSLIRSAAGVKFLGGSNDFPTVIHNAANATVSFYGGKSFFRPGDNVPVTSDATTGSFVVDNLRISGGTFDATGVIQVNAGGSLSLDFSTLRDTNGSLTIAFATPNSIFQVNGGLDLVNPVYFTNGGRIALDNVSNQPVNISGFDLQIENYDFTTADYSLSNGAHFYDAVGLSSLRNIQNINAGRTVTFNNANGVIGAGHSTYDHAFDNFGTLNVTNATVSFGDTLYNGGVIHGTSGGGISVAGDLTNGDRFTQFGTITGIVNVGGNLFNRSGSTIDIGGYIAGNLEMEAGSISTADALDIGGVVDSQGTLTVGSNAFRHLDNTYAKIYNSGSLTLDGIIQNEIISPGVPVHTRGYVELHGVNNYATTFMVDDGTFHVTDQATLGSSSLQLAGGTLLDLGNNQLTTTVVTADGARIETVFSTDQGVLGQVYGTGNLFVRGNLTFTPAQLGSLTLEASQLTLLGSFNLSGPLSTPTTGPYAGGTLTVAGDSAAGVLQGGSTVNSITFTGNNAALSVYAPLNTPFTSDVAFTQGGSVRFFNAALDYTGQISGNTTVELVNGSLSFSRFQPYTGRTTVDAGANLTLKSGFTGPIVNSGTLTFDLPFDFTYGAGTSITSTGSGSVVKLGGNTLTFLNPAVLSQLSINAGTLIVGDGTQAFTSGTVASNLGTLGVGQNGSMTLNVAGPGGINLFGSGNYSLGVTGGASGLNHLGSGTVTLAANQAISGPTVLAGGFFNGVFNAGGGTLQITDDTSLGAAPASYTAGYLSLGSGNTLRLLNSSAVTLAATRGVTVGDGATIDIFIGSLTIPTALQGNGALNKAGTGTLYLPSPSDQLSGYNVQQGTLSLDNGGTYLGLYAVSVALNATLDLTGAGETALSDFLGGGAIDGRINVAAGTTLTLGRSLGGQLDVSGAVNVSADNLTIARITGSGDFAMLNAVNHLTVADLSLTGSVTVTGDLTAPLFAAGTTHLGGTLHTTDGTTGVLDISGGAFDIANQFTVNGAVTTSNFVPHNTTIVKNGAGLLLFAGSGTIPDFKLLINDGTLAGAAGTVFSGVIDGAGTFAAQLFTPTDTVTLVADNTYTGGTSVNAGRLQLGNGGTTGSVLGNIDLFFASSSLAFDHSGTVTFANTLSGAGYLEQAGPADSVLVLNSGLSRTGAGLDPFTGNLRVTSGTMRLDDGATGFGTVVDNAALVFNNTGSLTLDFSGQFGDKDNITGTGSVTQAGTGTTTLGGHNTYTGATTVAAGTLAYATDFANAGGITVDTGATLALTAAGAVHGTVANSGVIALNRNDPFYLLDFATTGTQGAIQQNGTGEALFTNPSQENYFDIEGGGLGFDIASGSATSGVQLAGPGSFVKEGSGTLVWNGHGSSFAGLIAVNDGTLEIGDVNGDNASGQFNGNFSIASGSLLRFNRATDAGYGGVISGEDVTGGVAIAGAGKIVLSGANTYTGLTTIAASSTLEISGNGSLASGRITDNGTLRFNRTGASFGGNIDGTGLVQTATGTDLTLNGTYTNSGGAQIVANSTLTLGLSGQFGSYANNTVIPYSVLNNGTLAVLTDVNASTRSMPVSVTGTGGLNVLGGGILALDGAVGYTGATTLFDASTLRLGGSTTFSNQIFGDGNLEISGGTTILTANSSINGNVYIGSTLQFGDGSDNNGSITVNGAGHALQNYGTLAFDYSGPAVVSLTSPINGTGGIHQMGAGEVDLTSDNPNMTGTTTVDAGRHLVVGNGTDHGSLGTYSDIVANGLLELSRTGDLTLSNPITGGAGGVFERTGAGALTLDGTLVLDGQIYTQGDLTINSFPYSATNDGQPPYLTSHVDRIYAGTFTNAGNLSVGTFNTQARGAESLSPSITLPGIGAISSITNQNGATLTVTGENLVPSGSMTVVNAGTLVFGNGGATGSLGSAADGIINTGTLAVNRSTGFTLGSYLSVWNNAAHTNQGFGSIQNLGSGTLTIDGNVQTGSFVAAGTGTLEFASPASTGGAPISIGGTASGLLHDGTWANQITGNGVLKTDGTVSLTNGFNTYAGGVNIVSGTLTLPGTTPSNNTDLTLGSLAGAGNLTYSGTGALTIGQSTNTGTILSDGNYISAGGLGSGFAFQTAGGTLELTNTASGTLGSTTNIGTLIMSGTGSTTVEVASGIGFFTLNTGTLVFDSGFNTSNAVTANGGNLDVAGGAALGTVNGTAANYDIAGTVGTLNAGSGNVHAEGTGVIASLQSSGNVIADVGATLYNVLLDNTAGASLDLSAADFTLSSLSGGGSLGGNTNIGGRTLTLDAGSYAGAIYGTGSLIKAGAANDTLTLAGANTFTGSVTVADGTLAVTGSSLASGYTVEGGSTLTFGSAGSLATVLNSIQANFITLQQGTLSGSGSATVGLNQGITLANGGTLSGTLAVNSAINGTGTLTIGTGYVILNSPAPYAGAVNVTGTLALGNTGAITPANTTFASGSTFDVNGHNWSDPLAAEGVTIANGSATAATVTSPLTVVTGFGLNGAGGLLTFNGTVSTSPVAVTTDGAVMIGATPAPNLGTITVTGGNTAVALEGLTALTDITAGNGGQLQLTGTARDLSLNVTLNNGGTFFNDTNGAIRLTTALHGSGYATLGGTQDLTLAGSIASPLNLAKVGGDRLTIDSGTNLTAFAGNSGYSPQIDVRAGILDATAAFYAYGRLNVAGGATGEVLGGSDVLLRGLTGAGTFNLGASNLVFNADGSYASTGTLTTTGSVTTNSADGTTFGPSQGTQSFGTLTAGSLVVRVGDVVVTDALHASSITVIPSGAGGSLTTTLTGISTTGGTVLSGNFTSIQGTLRLTGGENLTGNAGNLILAGAQADVIDGNGHAVRFATNSNLLSATNGAALEIASTFTNTGTVSLFSGGYLDGAGTINQAGGASSSFTFNSGTLVADRFNLSGGTFTMGAGAVFQRTGSGDVLSNPGIVMTGGTLSSSGFISGGLAINGGTLNPGGLAALGTLQVGNGIVLGSAGHYNFDLSDASGDSAHDLLVASGGETSDGRITVNATAARPFVVAAASTTGGNLPNFSPAMTHGAWTIATSANGIFVSGGAAFTNADSARFLVDGSGVSTGITGNFGVAVNGNNLELQYDQSHLYDTTSGDIVVSTPLAAMGLFGGLRKSGTGTLTLAADNLYTGATDLDAGTLVVASAGALGTGNLVVTGGTLQSDVARTLANNVVLSGGTVAIGGAADLAFTGTLFNFGFNHTINFTNTGATTLGDISLNDSVNSRSLTFNTTGGNVSVTGTIYTTGTATGSLSKTGAGTLTLSGVNTYAGSTTVSAGTLVLGNNSALGTGTLSLGAGTVSGDGTTRTLANNLTLSGNGTFGGASDLTFTGTLTNSNANRTLTFANTGTTTVGAVNLSNNSVSRTLTLAGSGNAVITGAIGNGSTSTLGNLTMSGTGTVTLGGASTYTGTTTVNGGRLNVNGSIASSSLTTVNTGGWLGGSGSVGALNVTAGGTLAPGNSPGTLSAGSTLWSGGGNYEWQINNATGLAGTNYDLLSISGTLDLSGLSSASRFTLLLQSLLPGNTAGDVINFNRNANYTYTIASASGGIIGFSSANFAINQAGFTNANSSYWSLAQSGNNLVLNYSAIPEPSTYAALAGLGALGLVMIRRRRARA